MRGNRGRHVGTRHIVATQATKVVGSTCRQQKETTHPGDLGRRLAPRHQLFAKPAPAPIRRDSQRTQQRIAAGAIEAAGIPVTPVNKVTEGRPHIVDMIKNNEISLIVNTVDEKRKAINDSRSIRTSALAARVTMYTTVWGAEAAAVGMKNRGELVVYPIQTLHAEIN